MNRFYCIFNEPVGGKLVKPHRLVSLFAITKNFSDGTIKEGGQLIFDHMLKTASGLFSHFLKVLGNLFQFHEDYVLLADYDPHWLSCSLCCVFFLLLFGWYLKIACRN